MVTLNQLAKSSKRKSKYRRSKAPALMFNPYKKGRCQRISIRTPKKPNSAKRKIAKVKLTNGIQVIAYIPGENHTLQPASHVLVRGGRVKDLPGVKYHLVPGKYDFNAPKDRRQKRSKYGVKK